MRAIEKRLRERIKTLETELEEVKKDREAFRSDVVSNLRTAIQIHGKGQYWSMGGMIETFAKQIASKQNWYWW